MKCLIFFNTTLLDDKVGGSFAAVNAIIEYLKNYNIKIILLTFNYMKSDFHKYEKNGVIIIKLPDIRKNIFKFFFYLSYSIKFLNNNFNSIKIWAHSPLPWFFFSYFLKTFKKSVYTCHGPLLLEKKYKNPFFKFFYNLLMKNIFKNALKNIDIIQYNSDYVKQSCEKEFQFLKSKNNLVEEILVSPSIFLKNINNSKIENNRIILETIPKNYILISRRLVGRTGVLELIDLIINNDDQFSSFNFVITGSGENYLKIKKKIINKKYIYLIGEVSENDLLILKKNCLALIIPSLDIEGFSLIAKEGRLLKKCIIHTNQGGLKESLYGYERQIIFEIDNYKTLLNALNNLDILKNRHISDNLLEDFDIKLKKLNILN